MKFVRILGFLLLSALPLQAQIRQSMPSDASRKPRDIDFCEIAKDPAAYNHNFVRITAFVTHGFEDFTLADPSCRSRSPRFSIWLMYGGKTQSNTIYCCPGEGANEVQSESLAIEGIQLPLLTDATFGGFTNLLKNAPDTTVRVTLTGTFFSGAKQTINGTTSWGGFGHLGCCSLFVIQQVEAFEGHTRRDLDYTAEAGWYEKGGCDNGALRWVKHVSLSFGDEVLQTIADQKMADSGTRSWAFDNPERAALEALKPFYQNEVPNLRNVRRSQGRQVFQWKNGKKVVVVVVTRPYWLSFYAKSNSVAWVATTIKEDDCS